MERNMIDISMVTTITNMDMHGMILIAGQVSSDINIHNIY